ncbi:3-octaprenyl-4-hydroxybenzoate carboxy-lyase [Sphingobacteriales bacterium UPWRP_1]|nr:3-octaprenyl-4-hydroxybenzoate carboxy-lyase [Sphingobacteriales bacterium TSM_CSM]PSJ74578.1 3-octaprenyl-4-hydroxybenzoate carboxy-lyase [Sphingobacteriales bacterium UPWRP_1]
MAYRCMYDCLLDLEKHGHLVRITEEVDPHLEMAAIHRRVYEAGGPALWFTRVKGSRFTCSSNLFGTLERSKFMFRHTLAKVQKVVTLKANPEAALKKPWQYLGVPFTALNALPMRSRLGVPVTYAQTTIDQLPQIKSWPMDGGAFVTLPLVYTEDADKPGVMNSNLGMYRIQLSGNQYIPNKEIGLHYQLHRGIGVHQSKANAKGQPLKVSIFVGGPPAHILSAVMPLPEGLSELTFAGALGGRRFRYAYRDGFCLSSDADFVITGYVYPHENKPEGPFGDHLGYYSLQHDFPLMRVHKVWHRKNAVWSFTVVGRPPQEDTSFGALIHEITGAVIPSELPGLHEVNAVDAAGVHPLLLAIGSERYTPYYTGRKPQEILTIANHILGFGQMSLAKYLLIVAKEDNPQISTHHIDHFLQHLLERIDWTRDLHFQTKTSIDTLDYSGTGLNTGSKVVMAAAGEVKRTLAAQLPPNFTLPAKFSLPKIALPGALCITAPPYTAETEATEQVNQLTQHLLQQGAAHLEGLPLIVLTDDSEFTARNLRNFLWVTFTRSNPSHDIHGVDSFTQHKHWGCRGPLIIDARIKPHHAPPLVDDPDIEKRVDALGVKGKSLHGVI